ncbi:hypothetical protein CBER1_03457 [Cercospora berteroae]|uniref:Tautomerase cis-CaaD-like domain-containing protein n=1 Tax=Cercospora berteroae TaxID=357750 RepID=A0A2S6CLU3_9PEZI|nr:hypothetical protein CBER1_03457 [Cercospora berteroae]
MPLYEIRHTTPLNAGQEDALAQGITKIHSTKFTTPKLFVNVLFTPFADKTYYAGGVPVKANHIIANVRSGPSRTKADWDSLSREIIAMWDDIVGKDGGDELRTFFVLGGMEGGYEAGFLIPEAGGDQKWMADNWSGFEERARKGDKEFQDLMAEIKERGLFKGEANGH